FFFSSRRRHTRFSRDWSSDVCSSDLLTVALLVVFGLPVRHLRTAISDGRVFPGETDVRIVFDALASERFGPNRVDAHLLLVETRDRKSVVEGKSDELGGRRSARTTNR